MPSPTYIEQRATLAQTVVMALIVGTMLCLPACGLVAVASWLALGVTPHSFVTFGDRLDEPVGVLAWWLLCMVPASVYAAIARP